MINEHISDTNWEGDSEDQLIAVQEEATRKAENAEKEAHALWSQMMAIEQGAEQFREFARDADEMARSHMSQGDRDATEDQKRLSEEFRSLSEKESSLADEKRRQASKAEHEAADQKTLALRIGTELRRRGANRT